MYEADTLSGLLQLAWMTKYAAFALSLPQKRQKKRSAEARMPPLKPILHGNPRIVRGGPMTDFVWANSYPATEAPAILGTLARLPDAGYLYHLCDGRYSIVADVALSRSSDGHEPIRFAADDADPIFELAAENDATFCGTWGDEDEDDVAAAA
jgi:hypothetical protein